MQRGRAARPPRCSVESRRPTCPRPRIPISPSFVMFALPLRAVQTCLRTSAGTLLRRSREGFVAGEVAACPERRSGLGVKEPTEERQLLRLVVVSEEVEVYDGAG